MLKFDGIAIGTDIKAYDFEPMRGRHDRYIEGTIMERIETVTGYFYRVEVLFDAADMGRTEVNVPLETYFDFDNRITILEA